MFVPPADAQAMIPAGDTVDAFEIELPYIGSAGLRPLAALTAQRIEQPEPRTVLIDGYSEGLNPICHSLDDDKFTANDLIKLRQTAGAALFPGIDGATGIVLHSSSHVLPIVRRVHARHGREQARLPGRGHRSPKHIHIDSFGAADPTEVGGRDGGLVFEGDEIFVAQLTGPEVPALQNVMGHVRHPKPAGFEIEGIDLSAIAYLTGVSAMGQGGRPDIINFILLSAATPTVVTVPGRQGASVRSGDELIVYQYAGAEVPALVNGAGRHRREFHRVRNGADRHRPERSRCQRGPGLRTHHAAPEWLP